ncbi:hypothetical protein [Microvirga sp. 2TAF3]|uniref:hypothetical protein n=1 Tax=Microvirga sp. 2TAF3 TaxID=3233014 RepID=UPI003F99FC6D
MTSRLIPFKTAGNQVKVYVNPDRIAYIRENVGRATCIFFAAGVDAKNGELPFLLVDGDVDETAKKLNAAAAKS